MEKVIILKLMVHRCVVLILSTKLIGGIDLKGFTRGILLGVTIASNSPRRSTIVTEVGMMRHRL